MSELKKIPQLDWMDRDDIRPYIYVRTENQVASPGQRFRNHTWFTKTPVMKNPLAMGEVDFANQILNLESKAFASSNMAMPRWVFYDCAVMPGFVAGFAIKTQNVSERLREILRPDPESEWSPLSLFIVIPTMGQGEWVAHNLCSVNSLLSKSEQLYGLGFLTKAFGLWYSNVEVCCGMTQWRGPAIKLHSHYGALECLTAYTPVHSFATTLTYRLRVAPEHWPRFFDQQPTEDFRQRYKPAGFQVDPAQVSSLKSLQSKIEQGAGPFFLDSNEIRKASLDAPLTVYTPR